MTKKRFILLIGVLGMLFVTGCAKEKKPGNGGETSNSALTPTGSVSVPGGENQKEDKVLSYFYKEEKEESKDGDMVYFTSCLSYPVFEGDNAEHMNRFVEEIVCDFREWLPEAKENAFMDYEDAKGTEYIDLIVRESEEFIVNCMWRDEQVQVLFCSSYSYTGGAHPNTFFTAYVVDLKEGVRIPIETVLNKYAISKDDLASYVADRLSEEAEDGLFLEGEDLKNEVLRFMEDDQWYLTENGIKVFANPYDIAPYAAGMLECEISYKVLEEGLKK